MKYIDIKNIDLKLLMTFMVVYEENSVTKAAARMSVGQSLISHSLDRLRVYFADPLFVRSGRTMTPTNRARELAPQLQVIIEQLTGLNEPQSLHRESLNTCFTLAANDFERRIIAPRVFSGLTEHAPNASLALVHTTGDIIERLRNRDWDAVITPLEAPDLNDFYSCDLFEDQFVCFFDSTRIEAGEILSGYFEKQHAIVRFEGDPVSTIDRTLARTGRSRLVKLTAPGFEALPELIRGTRLVATLPSRLRYSVFKGFASVAVPFNVSSLKFKMIWHKTTHLSPRYAWFRDMIKEAPEYLKYSNL